MAQSRLYGILYISFCLPMQWLAAKTPELGEWGRGLTLNGGAINTLRKRIMDIVDSPTKVLNKGFMMNMFLQIWWCTPTLQGILGALVCKEENVSIGVWVWSKGASVRRVEEWAIYLSDLTNAATNEHLDELAKLAAQWILNKLHDEKKATWKYLSVSLVGKSVRNSAEFCN